MCQSTSTMKRKTFDAFLSNFFSRDFFIIDFNETSKKQKKDFQFFNLFRKLFTSSRQNEKTSSWRERELASEAVCLQRFVRRENHSFFFFFFLFLFFSFFFSLFFFIFIFFFFSLFLFERVRAQLVLRTNTIRSVDAFLFFDEKAKIDRDVEAKTFEKTSRSIINIFINVSFRRLLKDVDL